MILAKFKISGHSMMPYLAPGETIIVSSIPYLFSSPRIGDIVAFVYNDKTIIKRIEEVVNDEIKLKGDNQNDSLEIGKIQKKDILGKYIIKI